jgi:PIN domain
VEAVFFDTCVLLKSYLCDTLLSIAENGTYRPLWSAGVMDELQRNLLQIGVKPDAVDHRFRQMTETFPDALTSRASQLSHTGSKCADRMTSCSDSLSCIHAPYVMRCADKHPATGANRALLTLCSLFWQDPDTDARDSLNGAAN